MGKVFKKSSVAALRCERLSRAVKPPVGGVRVCKRVVWHWLKERTVLEGARRVLLFGEAHAADPEMSRFAYPLSEYYVELAGKMMPGDKLKLVHPHVLIVVENVERAFNAASHGDLHAFRQHVRTIREELATLDAVLKHLKIRLPEPVR